MQSDLVRQTAFCCQWGAAMVFFLGAIISQWLHNATNHFVLVSPREFIKIDNSFAALFFLTLIMEKFLLELKT